MCAPGGVESSKNGSVRIATSSPVSVPYTPSSSSALATSTDLIRACAYGERTKCTKPISCRFMSSKKTPSPCTSRLSSLRHVLADEAGTRLALFDDERALGGDGGLGHSAAALIASTML